MGSSMKTTVDIDDELLAAAKLAAVGRRTTLRELVEEGLERVLANDVEDGAFRLRDASATGTGAPLWRGWTDDQRLSAMYGEQ